VHVKDNYFELPLERAFFSLHLKQFVVNNKIEIFLLPRLFFFWHEFNLTFFYVVVITFCLYCIVLYRFLWQKSWRQVSGRRFGYNRFSGAQITEVYCV